MAGILLRACFFLLMVILGYGMKKAGVLTKDDGVAVARVVLNITLPCAILVSFRTFVFEWGYMVIPLISFAANWAMLGIGYMISRRSGRDGRIFYMLELPAYNIGNFTLPFVSGILGATGVVATCLFDMGNSPMCLGLNFMVTALVIGADPGKSLVRSVLSIFRKPSFTVYFVMLMLSMLSIQLPDVIFDFAGMISPANASMAMLMIGVGLKLDMDRAHLKRIARLLTIRYGFAAVFALVFYFLLPFELEIRQALVILVFSPIGSAVPGFTGEMDGDVGLSSALNSMTILISIGITVVLLSVML